MAEYISWIQLTITGLLFVVISGFVSRQSKIIQSYVDKEIGRMETRVTMAHNRIDSAAVERKTEYLREDKHALLCSKQTLELKQHVTAELKAIFEAIRELDKKISRLDGRTGFLKDKEHER